MPVQVIAFNSRVVLRPMVRTNIKRRFKEAVRLIVTRGATAGESRRGPKIVFRAVDIGADKWVQSSDLRTKEKHEAANEMEVDGTSVVRVSLTPCHWYHELLMSTKNYSTVGPDKQSPSNLTCSAVYFT